MMTNEVPQEVVEAFTRHTPGLPEHSAGSITVEKTGSGLINHSYKVFCELKPGIFLQRINKQVFHRPQDVQANYIYIWEYAEFEFTGIRLPKPVYLDANNSLYEDKDGGYWRAFELIADSNTIHIPQTVSQAKAVAETFARFTAAFSDMNTERLKEVIPGFHDLSLRYSQFEESLQTECYERMAKAVNLVSELKQRERYKYFFEVITESGDFPKRVMHHDAKISNVLFYEKNGEIICAVDFDTVMPGYFFSDLGDMIRSMATSGDESSRDNHTLHIRKDFYEAVISGYTGALNEELTPVEKKYIHSAGLLMIYMQALRFMTDYLNGDQYYQVSYPEQNFDRASNQLALLKSLEDFLIKEYRYNP